MYWVNFPKASTWVKDHLSPALVASWFQMNPQVIISTRAELGHRGRPILIGLYTVAHVSFVQIKLREGGKPAISVSGWTNDIQSVSMSPSWAPDRLQVMTWPALSKAPTPPWLMHLTCNFGRIQLIVLKTASSHKHGCTISPLNILRYQKFGKRFSDKEKKVISLISVMNEVLSVHAFHLAKTPTIKRKPRVRPGKTFVCIYKFGFIVWAIAWMTESEGQDINNLKIWFSSCHNQGKWMSSVKKQFAFIKTLCEYEEYNNEAMYQNE